MKYRPSQPNVIPKLALALILLGSIISVYFYHGYVQSSNISSRDHISFPDQMHGKLQCSKRYLRPEIVPSKARTENPRFKLGLQQEAKPILIKNATLIDGDGSIRHNADILLKDGLIAEIGTPISLPSKKGITIVQLRGQIVSPGIVLDI